MIKVVNVIYHIYLYQILSETNIYSTVNRIVLNNKHLYVEVKILIILLVYIVCNVVIHRIFKY